MLALVRRKQAPSLFSVLPEYDHPEFPGDHAREGAAIGPRSCQAHGADRSVEFGSGPRAAPHTCGGLDDRSPPVPWTLATARLETPSPTTTASIVAVAEAKVMTHTKVTARSGAAGVTLPVYQA